MRNVTLILGFFIVSMAMVTTVAANTKGEQLRRAMADISLLAGQLSQRKTDATDIRDLLSRQLEEIGAEVNKEIHVKGITKKNRGVAQSKTLP